MSVIVREFKISRTPTIGQMQRIGVCMVFNHKQDIYSTNSSLRDGVEKRGREEHSDTASSESDRTATLKSSEQLWLLINAGYSLAWTEA